MRTDNVLVCLADDGRDGKVAYKVEIVVGVC